MASINHLQLGLSVAEREHGLVSSEHFRASPTSSSVALFSSELDSLCPPSITREDAADFFAWDTSKRTFMLTVLIMIIFHSLPPTHSGIMVAGYTAGGIFGCLWKLLKDFTVKFTFIYLLLL